MCVCVCVSGEVTREPGYVAKMVLLAVPDPALLGF